MRWIGTLGMMILAGCGQGDQGTGMAASQPAPSQVQQTGTQTARYYVQDSDLPACDASTDHWLVYVASSRTFKACNGGTWTVVDVTGPAGATGATGPAGPAGPQGQAGGNAMASVWSFIQSNARAFVDIECAGGRGSGVKVSGNAIVTAFHVIDGETNCAYRSGGLQVGTGGTFVQASSGRDIGYIQGVNFNDSTIPSIPMARGETLALSAPILLVSYPADITNDFQVTPGVITDADVSNSIDGSLATEWAGAVTSDAAAGPGSSGGPIFDASGKFVGIHVGGYSGSSDPEDVTGLELNYHLIFTNAD